ncbi:hypothetical protein F4775DRAFT_568269, partial [Biscogniauxia sp. FL1348]
MSIHISLPHPPTNTLRSSLSFLILYVLDYLPSLSVLCVLCYFVWYSFHSILNLFFQLFRFSLVTPILLLAPLLITLTPIPGHATRVTALVLGLSVG